MSRYLFIVQNDTHAKNFVAFINSMNPIHDIDVILLDKVTKTDTKLYFDNLQYNKLVNILELPDISNSSFYLSNFFTKLRITFFLSNYIKFNRLNLNKYDFVYLGNDGAIQKVILKYVRKENNLVKITLMIDGFLTKKTHLKSKIKRIISKLLDKFSLSHYFPSEVGCSKYIDNIVVMHSSVKDVLSYHGVSENKINVTFLPRHHELMELAKKRVKNNNVINITYFTTGYKWHQLFSEHEYQIKQIEKLKNINMPNIILTIRFHPRDDINFYSAGLFKDVNISNCSLEEDLINSDLIIVSRSSVVFDALLSGCDVLIYNEFFEMSEIGSQFKDIPICNNINELIQLIRIKL